VLRPFPKKQLFDEDKSYYNYRLSRARMAVECAFGIAASKFRITQKLIEKKIENADHILKAICILHMDVNRGVSLSHLKPSLKYFNI